MLRVVRLGNDLGVGIAVLHWLWRIPLFRILSRGELAVNGLVDMTAGAAGWRRDTTEQPSVSVGLAHPLQTHLIEFLEQYVGPLCPHHCRQQQIFSPLYTVT